MKAVITHVEVTIIDVKVRSSSNTVQVQPHLVCAVKETYDSDNTDNEKVLPEDCDEINVLTVLADEGCRRTRASKALKKEKEVIQDHIKKQKQYEASKIICHEKYVNVPKAVEIQDSQEEP